MFICLELVLLLVNSSSSHPVINVENNYYYLINTLKLQPSNIFFEHFLASDSFPISYHVLGFKENIVIFTYKGENEHNQLRKYVSLISRLENLDELVDSVSCSIGFVDGNKKEILLKKIKQLYSVTC